MRRRVALLALGAGVHPFAAPILSPPRRGHDKMYRRTSSKAARSLAASAATDASPVPTPPPQRVPGSVLAILSAAFLNLLGFTMAGPITPVLGNHFDLSSGSKVGMLTSAYPAGMLLGLLVWPTVSDRTGMRKPVLVGSLAGVGFGLAAQAVCLELGWPLWAFLSLRAFSGAFAGASPVAKAFLADAAEGTDRLPRWLAWREASSTLAFIVGPTLGGLLYHATGSVSAVVGATSVGSLLAAAVVAIKAKPTVVASPDDDDQIKDPRAKKLVERQDAAIMMSCPLGTKLIAAVATIVCVSTLENAGSSAWDAFGAVVAKQRFDLDPREIGALLTTGACLSFVVSTALFDTISRTIGIVRTAVLGLSLIASGLLGVATAQNSLVQFALAAALYQLGKPLYAPTLPSLLLKCVPPRRRGFAMGIDSIFNTLARAVSPIVLGAVLHHANGSFRCFAAASSFVFAAALLASLRGLQVARSTSRYQQAAVPK